MPTTYPINQGGLGAKVSIEADAGIVPVPMSEGKIRGYFDYAEDLFYLTIEHFWLESTDSEAIISFYETNKALDDISVTCDEGTFEGIFLNRPNRTEKEGPFANVTSLILAVKV